MDESIMREFVANELRSMKCPDCGKYPDITVTSKGISISACCNKFQKTLIDAVKTQSATYVKRELEQKIKNRWTS